jgi:hypothetical protein
MEDSRKTKDLEVKRLREELDKAKRVNEDRLKKLTEEYEQRIKAV